MGKMVSLEEMEQMFEKSNYEIKREEERKRRVINMSFNIYLHEGMWIPCRDVLVMEYDELSDWYDRVIDCGCPVLRDELGHKLDSYSTSRDSRDVVVGEELIKDSSSFEKELRGRIDYFTETIRQFDEWEREDERKHGDLFDQIYLEGSS